MQLPLPLANPIWLLLAALAVLLGLHAFSWRVGFSELASPLWIAWPPIEAALWAGLLWAYLHTRWPGPLALRRRVDATLAALGSISFSTYVMHNLVIAAVNARLPLLPVPGGPLAQTLATGALVVLPATLAVATVTYWVIERPFLALRKSYLARTDATHTH